MKRINSKFTFVLKKIFPIFWITILILMVVIVTVHEQTLQDIVIGLMMTLLMTFIGVMVYVKLLSNLIDEVFLDNNALVLKNSGQSLTLNFNDIADFNYQRYMNPHKVTLYTHRNTKFGKKICFLAPTTFVPFKKNEEILGILEQINTKKKAD